MPSFCFTPLCRQQLDSQTNTPFLWTCGGICCKRGDCNGKKSEEQPQDIDNRWNVYSEARRILRSATLSSGIAQHFLCQIICLVSRRSTVNKSTERCLKKRLDLCASRSVAPRVRMFRPHGPDTIEDDKIIFYDGIVSKISKAFGPYQHQLRQCGYS